MVRNQLPAQQVVNRFDFNETFLLRRTHHRHEARFYYSAILRSRMDDKAIRLIEHSYIVARLDVAHVTIRETRLKKIYDANASRAASVDKWSSMNWFDLALAVIVRAGNSSSARQGPLPAEAMTLFTMPGCSRAYIGRCHRSNCTLITLARLSFTRSSRVARTRSADTDYDSDGSA